MLKRQLSEKFIYIAEFPKELSFIDFEIIKFNALKNYWGDFRITNNKNDYRYNYFNISDDKNIFWLRDYIKDKWYLTTEKNAISIKMSFIIQDYNQSINSHHHILPNDLQNSPTISCIYTLDCGKNPVDLVIEDSFQRFQTNKIRIPMKKNNLVFFNSDLNHCFELNNNKEPLINLSFSFIEK